MPARESRPLPIVLDDLAASWAAYDRLPPLQQELVDDKRNLPVPETRDTLARDLAAHTCVGCGGRLNENTVTSGHRTCNPCRRTGAA
jgi:hypothetical protein